MAKAPRKRGGSRPRSRDSWLLYHARAARDGWGHIRNSPVASLMSIALMAVAIGLPATLFALLDNQRSLLAQWGGEPTLSVFLRKDVSEADAAALAAGWQEHALIGSVEVISSSEAFATFNTSAGLTVDADDAHNPLPHVVVVTPTAAAWAHDQGDPLVQELRESRQVEWVLVDFAWVERLRALATLAARGLWVLSLLLVTATVLIVGNAIRGLVLQQDAEIKVFKLVGATDAFVRRPFLYSGAFHGILAGTTAVALMEVLFLALTDPIAAVAAAYMSEFTLRWPSLELVLAVIGLAGLSGWVGAWIGSVLCLRQFALASERSR